MSLFLTSETFDEFLLDSAQLQLANTYTIDGRVHRQFFGEDEDAELYPYEYSKWGQLRSTCFDLIKGKHTPLGFKFILCLSPEQREQLLSGDEFDEVRPLVSSLVFILNFRQGRITLTTGAALSGFSLDKSYEKAWDDYIRKLIDDAGLEFEEVV